MSVHTKSNYQSQQAVTDETPKVQCGRPAAEPGRYTPLLSVIYNSTEDQS